MDFKDALKQYKKVGASKATGDALCAMYAKTIESVHGGNPERYYAWLTGCNGNDANITKNARALLDDRAKAWDVLMAA